jgi:hypothetical protein
MQGVHRRGVDRSFFMVNITAFDHEVVQTAVGVQHQAVQNHKPKQG